MTPRAVIAIDGPAGAGKSTVARALAERLGVPHVDTGAYYRATTLAVLRARVDPADATRAADVAARVEIHRVDGRTRLDGADVEDLIRGPEVTAAVSAVSAHPGVRAALLAAQRGEVAAVGGVVEGRDAGTVVVPEADLKVWLTATPNERAARRAAERDEATAAHLADIARRDAADAAQMTLAPDAVEIDTTGRTIPDVVEDIVARLNPVRADDPGAPCASDPGGPP